MQKNVVSLALVAVLSVACGDSNNPYSVADGNPNTPDSNPNTPDSNPNTPDANPNTPDANPNTPDANAQCAGLPARMVVLGDSIMACVGGGGKNASTCGVKILHDYLDQNYAPGITYENIAISGDVTGGIPSQQNSIPQGAGHVLVVIYIGGNDLQPYLFKTDQQAAADFPADMARMRGIWENQIFPFFENGNNFPDGVTVIMDTQYNPYDDCNESLFMSDVKIDLLAQFNAALTEMADARSYVYITDQHGPFLGHGHSRLVSTCPYYIPNAEFWFSDLIHPNIPGYAQLASEWAATADLMYANCH